MSSNKTKILVVCALCVAMAFVLNKLPVFTMPNGGSVTACSMFFIALAGLWFGPAYGILSGVVLGLLDLVTNPHILNPMQVMLDYILGFGILGIAGYFRNMKYGMQIGYVAGALGRFLMVHLSGWIFWYALAPGSFVTSIIYNISYIGVEMAVTLVIVSIPAFNAAVREVPRRMRIA